MLLQPNPLAVSPISFLLAGGGLPLLGVGIAFSLWGLRNLVRPPAAGVILFQSLLSFVPALIAMAAIIVNCVEFAELAAAEVAPKPAAFGAVIGQSMSFGFCGLLATIVPVALGLFALHRIASRPSEATWHPDA